MDKLLNILVLLALSASAILGLELEKVAPTPKLFDPNWESLDSRPLPTWFDQGKIGIFIHWGVYSVPSHLNEWFWYSWIHDESPSHMQYMQDNFKPGFDYREFGPMFTAEFYNPNDWADLFEKSGAKYVVLTSKHHEGYALWPSTFGFAWNSWEVGSHRDLLGELAVAVRQTTLKFGIYYSLLEWFTSGYEGEKESNWATNEFPRTKSIPTLKEVINRYEPEVIWSDGEWEAPDTYWEAEDFVAWLYNESPVKDTVVTNDRWGSNTRCVHGGYFTCQDRYNPGVLQPHKWENAMTLDKVAWTFRRDAKFEDYLTPEELITTLVMTVSCGGNLLVNVGPSKEGIIPVIMQERLLQMGEWLGINGEAIYDSVPWTVQNDTLTPGVWYTGNPDGTKVYAIAVNGWPGETLDLQSVENVPGMTVQMLGTAGDLEFQPLTPTGISVTLPRLEKNPSKWAWTLVINLP